LLFLLCHASAFTIAAEQRRFCAAAMLYAVIAALFFMPLASADIRRAIVAWRALLAP